MSRHWREQTGGDKLLPQWTYSVEVCGFTFRFSSLAQLREVLAFYRQKTHPSSRLPDPAWVRREAQHNPNGYRETISAIMFFERDALQRWFEKVPMYLQENGKRERVVQALGRALEDFASDDGRAATA